LRIIVVSDTHGNYNALKKIFEKNLSADMFIHLGDGEREFMELSRLYPQKAVRNVAGNCDFAPLSPEVAVIGAGEHKIIASHGHRYGVKYGIDHIKMIALKNGADIVLFGHSHVRFNYYEDGIYFFNPGSASSPRDGKRPSYGFIDITAHGVVANHVDL